MTDFLTILMIPMLVAMFLAMTMGGSGTAPSFSAAYGAGVIRKDMIPGIFGIMVFIGALFAGKQVALTLGKGLIEPNMMTLTLTTIVLLSVALSLFVSNWLGIPQSTSQSTVFAICGPATYLGVLNTKKLFLEIIPTWFILPFISFVVMYLLSRWVYKPLKKYQVIGFEELKKHPALHWFVLISSCYVAFSIGSNNVANAAGPLTSMVMNEMNISPNDQNFNLVMLMSFLIIAPCFGIGSSLFGNKVVESTGKEIVKIGPWGASMIATITATLLLSASLFKGIPTSLVQLNTAAIIALGISKRGWRAVMADSTVKKFWIMWILAPIFSLLFSLLLTYWADQLGWLGI